MNYKNGIITLPGEKYYFEINSTPGDNFIIFLFSTYDISLTDLVNSLSKISGDIADRFNSLFEYSIISNKNVIWSNNEISFSATGNGEFFLPVYIDIRH